ncbi:hypothetical protein [Saccharothrix yanglingensis]|uniref:hypothetical protein n=1 Tax=Saccharothrix yanglingensis TaxID=659496 RepID=UPI0027D2D56B|nr:hypothetical protein [Saccharothrix yanglingensis]
MLLGFSAYTLCPPMRFFEQRSPDGPVTRFGSIALLRELMIGRPDLGPACRVRVVDAFGSDVTE